uniref:Uncharacterized protein n=1 Tax=Triticum urartu TaxID=4572 RepID=A0A8R7VEX9_TRIUA
MEEVTSFQVHDSGNALCSIDVHPTKPYVLAGCGRHIKLWDWYQGWNCLKTFEEQSRAITELKFNPEETNSFASTSWDNTVKVWSLDSPKSKYTLSGHLSCVHCLDFFTCDGQQYLISGSRDKTAKIWDLQKEECVHTLEHESAVIFVRSHANLPVLVTGTWDCAVHVWSSTDFRLKTILQLGPGSGVAGFACLMGSGRFAVAHEKGVSIIQIPDEEEQSGCGNGSNENSISATD